MEKDGICSRTRSFPSLQLSDLGAELGSWAQVITAPQSPVVYYHEDILLRLKTGL